MRRGVRRCLNRLVMQISEQSPSRYLGQEQSWRSPFDSGFNPWWFEASSCWFNSNPAHFVGNDMTLETYLAIKERREV